MRIILTELTEMDWNTTPPDIAEVVYYMVKEQSNEDDPYRALKKECNDIALGIFPELKRIVDQSATPLVTAVRLAIAGNVMDHGMGPNFDIKKTISFVLEKEFGIDHFYEFVQTLEKSQNLAYIVDNAGEIVFDKLLLETIMKKYDFQKILFAVNGAPFIDDATMEDAVYAGIDRMPGVEIIRIGLDEKGIKRSSKAMLDIIAQSDIIISKGQKNYEVLSDKEKIFFMLIAKCPLIAKELGAKTGDIILKSGGG